MADLIHKTQFEKICRFPLLSAVMNRLKELQVEYEYSYWGEVKTRIAQVTYDLENPLNTISKDYELCIEISALSMLMTQKIGSKL